jgi:ABC-type transport system involved in multi-copper enzyme maturation permease subunit
VENGWRRGWEEHPRRIFQAVELVTPVPSMIGVAAPRWWERTVLPGLGAGVPAWEAGLVYALFLLAAAGFCTWIAVRGYLRLAGDPDLLDEQPRSPTEEGGREFYWKGFRNPMLTRDIRTRLRSKDTAEYIFFASIAVAAGFFIPLLLTTGDLSDPLTTAKTARQVFFWLTMTLVALVSIIAPGLTADSITQERSTGALEMLVATPLRPREILVGKLLGAVCVMLLLVSPSFPLLGLCYLFHGASGQQVLGVYGLLLITLTTAALIGVTQSSINARAGSAKFFAYASTAFFVAVPGGPFWIAAAASAPEAGLRQQLSSGAAVSTLVAVISLFVLALFWGNACEQLEYSEY